MPTISRFLGVIISMYHNDHPPPHFHVSYGDDEALIDIESFELIAGHCPTRLIGVVRTWAHLHQEELRANWDLARRAEPLRQVAPLK